jgi:kynurenine formamidase
MHFDAPIHWITGKDFPNNATDTIDFQKFIVPAPPNSRTISVVL